jgi:hypothetical protein
MGNCMPYKRPYKASLIGKYCKGLPIDLRKLSKGVAHRPPKSIIRLYHLTVKKVQLVVPQGVFENPQKVLMR